MRLPQPSSAALTCALVALLITPTANPTPNPAPNPIANPIPNPIANPIPTANPTPIPTANPTPTPTPNPNANPTAIPIPIPIEQLADDIHLLRGGRDGNVLLVGGADGALLVDSLVPGREAELFAALSSLDLAPAQVRFVVSTHYHEDHVGANDELAGHGAVLVAQDEVRRLMTLDDEMPELGWTLTPAPSAALPTLTFAEALTLHVGAHELALLHMPAAHTSGDTIVHVRDANVIHVGDLFELGAFPFVDLWHGGSFDGLLAAQDRIAELCDDSTRIVPGHGPVSDRTTLLAQRDVVARVLRRAQQALDDGLDFDAFIASGPLDDVDPKWGTGRDAVRFAWLAYTDRVLVRDAAQGAMGEDGG